jgi:hypothetical protein
MLMGPKLIITLHLPDGEWDASPYFYEKEAPLAALTLRWHWAGSEKPKGPFFYV